MKNTLKVSPETFVTMISGLIASGVTFTSEEAEGWIVITFNGGY